MHGRAPVYTAIFRNLSATRSTGVATTCPFPISRAPPGFAGSRTCEVRNYGGILRPREPCSGRWGFAHRRVRLPVSYELRAGFIAYKP